MTLPERKLAIAPMMDWTDRHCRSFMRIISKHILLYTEMVTSGAIIHGDRQKLLEFSEYEKPLALQVGGSHAEELARCAEFAEEAGFDEINLNVGCPSDRVQSGRFGACLMAEPGLVAECVSSMLAHTRLPVTVKTRLGIDDHDSYEYLCAFIQQVAASGCRTFILHARKAWLQGLSPRENREIPPLRYDTVYAVKKDFPELEIIINGGFTTLEQVKAQYRFVDGVMIGRAAYQNPYLLARVDRDIFHDNSIV
ncbi:MAG TPA: tRNA dihydrouridine(20/20a) synthase DusA, partial [Gammaproteobacteria bacterium]|nr:tRNA dihydrouridine(20/20a) synthase DusA [Gammaproteobacteria bacterium]